MPVTADRARALALALPKASEAPHFNRTALRTPRRIFATLGPDGADLILMFDPDLRDHFCALAPHAFSPVPGGWGLRGGTSCNLAAVDEPMLTHALTQAHQRAIPAAPRRRRR